jgi:hypothetical protein
MISQKKYLENTEEVNTEEEKWEARRQPKKRSKKFLVIK